MISWNLTGGWPAIVNFGMLLIWGAQLHQRVKTLEAEITALKDVNARMARVETRLDGLFEQFKELNASIRWMRQPPAPTIAVRENG